VWYQLTIHHALHDQIDSITEALEQEGAVSVSLTDKNDDPVLEPQPGETPLWPEVIISALFSDKNRADNSKTDLSKTYPSLLIHLEEMADRNWETVWMDDFKPIKCGQRLWICPSWHTPPDANAVNLKLDPGLAFGSGTHATTSLCLQWLDQADLLNKDLIDFGCGSGILALAALKLGAHHVYAVDIDQQALQATNQNAQENKIEKNRLTTSTPEHLHQPVEIVIANILLSPLVDLKLRFHELLKKNGTLVVSGILSEQTENLIEAYEDEFQLQQSQIKEDWGLLVFKKLLH